MVQAGSARGSAGEHLWNEDTVLLAIGRHRMRTGRLRNGLDQDTGPVDDAEHGAAPERRAGRFDRRAGARVIAIISRVKPHLVRAGNTVDSGSILSLRIDN